MHFNDKTLAWETYAIKCLLQKLDTWENFLDKLILTGSVLEILLVY